MFPHQFESLKDEIRKPEFAGMSADELYLHLSHQGRLASGLGTTRFLTQADYEAMPEKRRPERFHLIADSVKSEFPSGVPGFPNKLRREWFDKAFAEVRG